MGMLCEGVDNRIVETMAKYSNSLEIQKSCCEVIITLSQDLSLQNGIIEAQGAEQIAIAIVMFVEDFDLIEKCFKSFRHLSHDSFDNKLSIVKSSAVDSIVSAMHCHRNRSIIQSSA